MPGDYCFSAINKEEQMFKIGDVVQLKSGGPAMTVLATGEEVECLFYGEESETFRRESLPAFALERVEFEDEAQPASDDDEDEDEEDAAEDSDEDEDEDEKAA